jgi:hypothetical protein
MLTIRNANVETISRDAVNIGGHEIPVSWDHNGAHLNRLTILELRREGLTNLSNNEIEDLAYHAETRLNETYSKAYEIGIFEGYNRDQWHSLASIRAVDDAAANAYAEQHYPEHEWYVLDANGRNINGGAA